MWLIILFIICWVNSRTLRRLPCLWSIIELSHAAMSHLPFNGRETIPSTVVVVAACSLGFICLLATVVLLSRTLCSLVIYLCCLFYRGVEGNDDFMQSEINLTIIPHAAHQILLVLLKSAIIHDFKTNVYFIWVLESYHVSISSLYSIAKLAISLIDCYQGTPWRKENIFGGLHSSPFALIFFYPGSMWRQLYVIQRQVLKTSEAS